MSSLSRPEPPPRPPVLSTVRDSQGRAIATVARRPGATSAILRDAQGRLRTRIDSGEPALEAIRYIKTHLDLFQPESEENSCPVDPQR